LIQITMFLGSYLSENIFKVNLQILSILKKIIYK